MALLSRMRLISDNNNKKDFTRKRTEKNKWKHYSHQLSKEKTLVMIRQSNDYLARNYYDCTKVMKKVENLKQTLN